MTKQVAQPLVKTTWLAITSLKRPTRPVFWLTTNIVAEANLAAKLLPRPSKLSLHGVRNNSCESSGMLIVDKDIKLAINKQRLKTVLLAPNTKLAFNPAVFHYVCKGENLQKKEFEELNYKYS